MSAPVQIIPALTGQQVQRWAMTAMGQLTTRENQLIGAVASLRSALRAEQFYQTMNVDEQRTLRESHDLAESSLRAVQVKRGAVYEARFSEL